MGFHKWLLRGEPTSQAKNSPISSGSSPSAVPVATAVEVKTVAKRESHLQLTKLGLTGLAFGLLGVTMNKDPAACCVDWTANPLSTEQLNYAVNDAIYSRDVLMAMFERRTDPDMNLRAWVEKMSKTPSKPATCNPQQQAPTKRQHKPVKGKVKAAEAMFAGQPEKRAAVAGAFTAARQFYESGDGAINLLDPLHCTGVVIVRYSSIEQEATEKRAKLC